jgi:hypothetical protein
MASRCPGCGGRLTPKASACVFCGRRIRLSNGSLARRHVPLALALLAALGAASLGGALPPR